MYECAFCHRSTNSTYNTKICDGVWLDLCLECADLTQMVASPIRVTERDKIIFSMLETRRQRQSYNKNQTSPNVQFTAIGRMWGALLSLHLGIPVFDVPGWLVCILMSAIKLARLTSLPTLQDSYEDGMNYIALAHECYNEDHPNPPKKADNNLDPN